MHISAWQYTNIHERLWLMHCVECIWCLKYFWKIFFWPMHCFKYIWCVIYLVSNIWEMMGHFVSNWWEGAPREIHFIPRMTGGGARMWRRVWRHLAATHLTCESCHGGTCRVASGHILGIWWHLVIYMVHDSTGPYSCHLIAPSHRFDIWIILRWHLAIYCLAISKEITITFNWIGG